MRRSTSSRRSGQNQQQQGQTWVQWASTPAAYVAALVRRLPGGSWLAGSGKRQQEGGLRRRGSDLFDRPSGGSWIVIAQLHVRVGMAAAVDTLCRSASQAVLSAGRPASRTPHVRCHGTPCRSPLLHFMCHRVGGVGGGAAARLCRGAAPQLRAGRDGGVRHRALAGAPHAAGAAGAGVPSATGRPARRPRRRCPLLLAVHATWLDAKLVRVLITPTSKLWVLVGSCCTMCCMHVTGQ